MLLRLVPFLLVGCLGCSYEWHTLSRPQDVPLAVTHPQVDVRASDVTLVSTHGIGFSPREAEVVRNALANSLDNVIRPRHPEDHAPGRFRVKATLERKGLWSIAYLFLPVAPVVGAPTHRVRATVELELQIGEDTYRGTGQSRVFGGFWYNHSTREKALARAFRQALLEAITASGAAPAATTGGPT